MCQKCLPLLSLLINSVHLWIRNGHLITFISKYMWIMNDHSKTVEVNIVYVYKNDRCTTIAVNIVYMCMRNGHFKTIAVNENA